MSEQTVDTLNSLSDVLGGTQLHIDVNPADDQHAIFRFNFSPNVCGQPATTCIDFARFQRAPEGSEHSPARRCDNVVQRRRVRLRQFCLVNSIVLRNCAMDAEFDRIGLTRKIRYPEGSLLSLDMNVRNVYDV